MSVRRLADEAIQPSSFAFTPENLTWARAKIAEYPAGRQQSAVLPLLMRVQDQEGWLSRKAIEYVADMIDMPYIRALEVVTFYTQFQLQPVGTRAHIQVCGTTPCMLRGAEGLRAVCERRIHPEPHHTNEDGTLSWEEVECLGACVNAPLVAIGHDTYEDLSAERLEEIIDAFAAGKGGSIKPGPQIDRQFAAAEGGATTLLEPPTAERTRMEFPPPAPAAAAPAAAPAASPAPTTAGRKRDVSEEAAPAIKEPKRAAKVSMEKAEAERLAAGVAAKADGTPNRAMREDATGAESPAGKLAGGAAVGKPARARLFEAPSGRRDDLKLIAGVGPVLEQALNEIGITTWSQLSGLTPEQIAALEGELGFPGRVGRDNWLEQAAVLARGGIEEYRKVFGKDPR